MGKINLLILCVLIAYPVCAQVVSSESLPKPEESEKQELDKAVVRTYYVFTQKEKSNDATAFRNDTMTLDIGGQMSHYYDVTKSKKDSVAMALFNNLNPSNIKSISVFKNEHTDVFDNYTGEISERNYYDGTTEKIYKNRIAGHLTLLDYTSNGAYKCEDAVGSFPWEITGDTATIFNYLCQKATVRFRGRNYEAWFTPEIPINDGPWKFFGLPGLIVKVTDTEDLINFECIGLQYLEQPYEIAIPKGKYIKCKRKELEKVIKDRGASMSYGINGGNVLIVNKSLSSSFKFLELE
jgi:GLPGLI family protein